jgi:hypothetical protein
MNKRLPCYIVSDLLPLYQDDILSEQTKKDIDKHLTECRECQKKMAAMKTQLDIQNTNVDLKINPLKKTDSLGSGYSIHFRCMHSDRYIRVYCS